MADQNERQESHDLIHQLKLSQGSVVRISVLGGYSVEGLLLKVNDELASVGKQPKFLWPGGGFFSVNTVATVNLETIVAIGNFY
jgi:hypothetical protein